MNKMKMDLAKIEWRGVDCIGVAHDRGRCSVLVNTVMNFQIPYNFGRLSSGCKTGDRSSSSQLHKVSAITMTKPLNV
jgi:hypothetical protein